MSEHELTTVDAVINELGGTSATAKITGRKDQHVSNWRAARRLPANTFLILQAELRERGKTAPPSLWGIREPEQQAS
jgi:hypothetical protein